MKILSAAQIKLCDEATISSEKMSSIDLMERAATACTNWLMQFFSPNTPLIVLCGCGNNGGDGLAIARILYQKGYSVKAYLLSIDEKKSNDCSFNYQRAVALGIVEIIEKDNFLSNLPTNIIIIDAIFGIGLNRPLNEWIGRFIQRINELYNIKIAIDIPSGLSADYIPQKDDPIFHADYTLTFEMKKRTMFHPEAAMHCGNIDIINIGLNKSFIQNTPTIYQTIEKKLIKEIIKPRNPFGHKGAFGNAMLIAGSHGMNGAAVLASKACLKSGVGKLTTLIPECGYSILQTSVPEAMCLVNGDHQIQHFKNWEKADAIGIGPGLGTSEKTLAALSQFLEQYKKPIVIDADALNLISRKKELLHLIPKGSILTPHVKEFERLFGSSNDSMARLELARMQAMKLNCVIVLKGKHSVVISPEGECWYNTTGNNGMATAGSGDVLTGMITSFLAQGYQSLQAALLGVFIHGMSGDLALQTETEETLLASDIINNLNQAFKSIR